MRELAKEYKKSIMLLKQRVNELEEIKEFLTSRTKDPEKDPDIIELNERLKPLRNMLNDLKEVTREVEHYYDRWWWRSEKYTCNARKSRRYIYAEPIYDEGCYEYGETEENENSTRYGCGFIIDK